MAPKKKGASTTPVVVGTVSTRSTRRQSIVNIEIPRLSKKSRKPKTVQQTHVNKLNDATTNAKSTNRSMRQSKKKNAPSKVITDILDDWSDKGDTDYSSETRDDSCSGSEVLSKEQNQSVQLTEETNVLESQSMDDTDVGGECTIVESSSEIILDEPTSEVAEITIECVTSDTIPVESEEVYIDSSDAKINYEDCSETVSHVIESENVNDGTELSNNEAISDESKVEVCEEQTVSIEEISCNEESESSPLTEQNVIEEPADIETAEIVAQNDEEIIIDVASQDFIEIGNEPSEEDDNTIVLGETVVDENDEAVDELKYDLEKSCLMEEDLNQIEERNEEVLLEAADCKEKCETNIEELMETSVEKTVPDEKLIDNENKNIDILHEKIVHTSEVEEMENSEILQTEKEVEIYEEKIDDQELNLIFGEEINNVVENNSTKGNIEDGIQNISLIDRGEQCIQIDNIESEQDNNMEKCETETVNNEDTNLKDELDKLKLDDTASEIANSEIINVVKELQNKDNIQMIEPTEIIENKDINTECLESEIKTEDEEKPKPETKSKKKETTAKTTKKKTIKNAPKETKPKVKAQKGSKVVKATKEPKKKDLKVQKEPKTQPKKSKPKPKKEDKVTLEEETEGRRRSSRIKSITVPTKKTKGLVKSKSDCGLNEADNSENSNSAFGDFEKSSPVVSVAVKEKTTKSRVTRSSENLSKEVVTEDIEMPMVNLPVAKPVKDKEVQARLKQFTHIKENQYKTDRMTCKEAKKMSCDCFLTDEEVKSGEYGCGDDCLNRLLMIECGNLCPINDRCTNKRFQKGQFAPVEVFNTEKKGLGLRAAANIPYGEFILEYVGEVLDPEQFDERAEHYSQDKNIHYYFMSLRADAIIDATVKGNISRFINHSCDPNAETQKWTVNGELRIGFFSTRTILAGEEITFDYRFQRYGKEAQKCYCESSLCRGWLGERPDSSDEDEDEEEVEDETETIDEEKEIEKIDDEIPQEIKPQEIVLENKEGVETKPEIETPKITKPKRVARKKARKEIFEELDQLDEEIEMLVETGLKNQAHTLKLSRLMVRAKETSQRAKLLRILRRGELACRRLFLDYHGLRLMHGYMIDAQHLVKTDSKFESCRLEMLQTLAMLPIPNKTMLQDSKVLPTVEKWSRSKDLDSPGDSDSNSPKDQDEESVTEKADLIIKDKIEGDNKPSETDTNYKEEIVALALKLLEEWSSLKEVFRIPKKERIEQMKEHEREANKKYIMAQEQDSDNKLDSRYRSYRNKYEKESSYKKFTKMDDKERTAALYKMTKYERRKLFALQVELREEERRRKQREMWRQHEQNCLLLGMDPRLTAPFDPNRGFQYVWNAQIGQWQSIPLPPENQFGGELHKLPNMSIPPPPIQKTVPNFPYKLPSLTSQPTLPYQTPTANIPNIPSIPNIPNIPNLPNIPNIANITSIPNIPNIPNISNISSIPNISNIPNKTQPPLQYQVPPPAKLPVIPPAPLTYQNQPPPLPYTNPVVYQENKVEEVKFMGAIPPPVKLPPKWKCAKDKYGRPYYYHIKLRKSQWEPPPYVEPVKQMEESTDSDSSTESSSLSSDSSSENSDSDDEIDDTKLLLQVRKQMEKSAQLTFTKTAIPSHLKTENANTPSPDDKSLVDNEEEISSVITDEEENKKMTSIDIRLKEQFNLLKEDHGPPPKKRRTGLVQEIIISPRTEEDRLQFREDLKRYKYNKEKLKREKEMILQQTKKQIRELEPKKTPEKKVKTNVKLRIKDMPDFNSEAARKIKETFRSNMATTVVSCLNGYRKPDCKEARITNTEDFKHLARKLTHFVMLKEMKHIAKIEDLTCTDNVKSKAREYIKKYMSKFGETYQKRPDEPDFKD